MTNNLNLIETYGPLIRESLGKYFGLIDPASIEQVIELSEWQELRAGKYLIRQGEQSTDLYILISGRLIALINKGQSKQEILGEITRGETIGEMALFTGEPRSASIVAVRDSLLLKLSKAAFQRLLKDHPEILFNITRVIIQRLKRVNLSKTVTYKVVNICIAPGSQHLNLQGIASDLHKLLSKYGKCMLLSTSIVDVLLGKEGIAKARSENQDDYRKLSMWLEKVEAAHDFLIYIAEDVDSGWTERCLRQADEILFVCQNDGITHPLAKQFFSRRSEPISINKTLVLLHEPSEKMPAATGELLKKYNFKSHHHVRLGNMDDLDRLARFLSGNAVGLVLSGGGARGLAHIGVYKAMAEAGIKPDMVGGTSIGSIIGGLIAVGTEPGELEEMARQYFLKNPTPITDLNFLPLISLMRGRKMEKLLNQVFGTTTIEDCWLNFYCVSTNLTSSAPVVHNNGSLATAIRCSISLPGIFPPVINGGCVHVDGGIFNNLPIDVMNSNGIKKIAAVDLEVKTEELLEIEKLPNAWGVIKSNLGMSESNVEVPTLMSTIIHSCTVASDVQARRWRPLVGLYFNPKLSNVGLMEWKRFDEIVEFGYRHAVEVLDTWEGF